MRRPTGSQVPWPIDASSIESSSVEATVLQVYARDGGMLDDGVVLST